MASTESQDNDIYETDKDRMPSVAGLEDSDDNNRETDTFTGEIIVAPEEDAIEEINMEEREGDAKDIAPDFLEKMKKHAETT